MLWGIYGPLHFLAKHSAEEIRRWGFAPEAYTAGIAALVARLEDADWGERLVGLVRSSASDIIERLQDVTQSWPAAERPQRWLFCPELAPSEAGKWQRSRWQAWLQSQESDHPPEPDG